MTRDEVLTLVKGVVLEAVPELKGEGIDPTKTYQELGINSLDLVTIVTEAMRRLNVKIPRTELARLQDLNGLVDLFLKAANATEA